jgi:Tol biopolymer transport system component
VNRRLLNVLLGIGILIILGAVVFSLAPRLEDAYPGEGASRITTRTPLKLVFSSLMQEASVETRLETAPPRTGTYNWEGASLTFIPDQPWPSGMVVTVTLGAGVRSSLGIPQLGSQSWSFRTNRPMLAYLWPADGSADIYTLDPISGDTQRLTNEPVGILDFDISADGLHIYYSTRSDSGGSAIIRLDWDQSDSTQILVCPDALCSHPRIAPDGNLLAYEATPLAIADGEAATQVLVLELDTGTDIFIGETGHQTGNPVWSSNGLLAYYDNDQGAYQVLDPASDERIAIPTETGEAVTWAPDGLSIVLSEIVFWGSEPAEYSSHLTRFDYPAVSSLELSRGDNIEDATPVFSPGGTRIAFGRKYLDGDNWTPGRQLWLMNADGSGAHPLTDDPAYNHTAFAWSPDEERLAFVRYNQATLIDPPELWLVDADGANPLRLMIGGYAPQWIP